MSDPPLWSTAAAALALLLLALTAAPASSAPMQEHQQIQHQLDEYYGGLATTGCYYNFVHYEEGDRIMTNEPCLNCTCHNRMLMCYLRVCPFSKGIGQDCTVEQKPDQCCPVITCPEVPVQLVTSSTTVTTPPAPTGSTAVGHPDNYGCTIDEVFYSDGTKIPGDPMKPCELCYCIRNHTACVMQECTLHVEGCRPVYAEGVCCPVRYDCDYQDFTTSAPLLETTIRPTPGLLLTTTLSGPLDCRYGDEIYADGALIKTEEPCQHCYCMRGDIVCAVQECGTPLEREAGNCTALPPQPGQCCPQQYQCDNGTMPFDILSQETEIGQTSKSTVSSGSTKSDHLLPVSTEASVLQQAETDEEQKVDNQTNGEETQQHLNEVDQDSEQHTLYEDEEHEKDSEIQHNTQGQEDTIEHITQTVEQFPEHSEQSSTPVTLESESSVTESVIVSSEKQKTTLGGASASTESFTEKGEEASITQDEHGVEQVTQEVAVSSSFGENVHDGQSATFITEKLPTVVATTMLAEKDSGQEEIGQQEVDVSSPPLTESGTSGSIGEPSILVTEINNSEETQTEIGAQANISTEREVSAVVSQSEGEEQLTTDINELEDVTAKNEVSFTVESISGTEKTSGIVQEDNAQNLSTEKVELQDVTTVSSIVPEGSPGDHSVSTETQFVPGKTEEPVIVQQSEANNVESHETTPGIYDDTQDVTIATITQIKPVTDQSGLVMPVAGTEQETVSEDENQIPVDSLNHIAGTENEEGHVTHVPQVDISSAEDKIDMISHEQSVTQAIIAEESDSSSSEQVTDAQVPEQAASGKPLEENLTVSDELESSTDTGTGDSATIISEPVTVLSTDKKDESNWQATEVPKNEYAENELESFTKIDEVQHTTIIYDNGFTPSEVPSIAESKPADSDISQESVTQGEKGVTNIPLPSVNEEQQSEKSESNTLDTVESSTHRVPIEDVSKPNAQDETINIEKGDEAEGSVQVTDSNYVIGTIQEHTENIVTTLSQANLESETGTQSDELLITNAPEVQQPVIFNEEVSESADDSTEDSIHHLVSEMNGKPTEIHTTPSETVSSAHPSQENSSVDPVELELEGSGSTESSSAKEPAIVQDQTEVEKAPEHEDSHVTASNEDKEVSTEFALSVEHGDESATSESGKDEELQKPVEDEEKTDTLISTSTEHISSQTAEEQTHQKPTENVEGESNLEGSHVITTPGIDRIEEDDVLLTQKPFEIEGSKEVMEDEILPSQSSEASTESIKGNQSPKPVEDGVQMPIEVNAESSTTLTLVQEGTQHHESEESTKLETGHPSSFPLTTEGIGGFIQELSTISPVQGPVGISTSEPQHAVIPGEGNCLVDGITYTNNSDIPPPSPCHVSCLCKSSIVHCVSVNCPPPPTHLENCTPVRHSDDACCPTYTCDVKHEVTLVADNHMAGTEQPTISGEASMTHKEEHKEVIKQDGVTLVHTVQGSDTATESQLHQNTEHGSEAPINISTDKQENVPVFSAETQTSHLLVTEKPSDDHREQEEGNVEQSNEIQHAVKPEDDFAVEQQTLNNMESLPTETSITERTDSLGNTISSSEGHTSHDKNEELFPATQKAPVHITTVSGQPTKEEHTQILGEVAEHITISTLEQSPSSSGDVFSPGLSSDTEEGKQPSVTITGDAEIHAEVSPVVEDEHKTEKVTESAEHVTQPVLATILSEESVHGDQFSHTLVSSTEEVLLSSEQTAATDTESVSSEQLPVENDSEVNIPSVITAEHEQNTVTIIHSDVPSVAPPESDSQSKYPTTPSEEIKPEHFDHDEHTVQISTEKTAFPVSEVSSDEPNEISTDEQQATVSPASELASEEPSDHTQGLEHPTGIPTIQATEETIPLHEEGSGHAEVLVPDTTDKAELDQQQTHLPENIKENDEAVSENSFPSVEQVTSATESDNQLHLKPTEAVLSSEAEEEDVSGPTSSPTFVGTEHPDISQKPSSEENIHSFENTPTDSSSQHVVVSETHILEGTTLVAEEQGHVSGETGFQTTPQYPSTSGENESGEQVVTSPISNEDEQQENTDSHEEELQTETSVDDHEQTVEQSTSKQSIEEQKTQLVDETLSISKKPDSDSQEKVTEESPENLQTTSAVESSVQQTFDQQHQLQIGGESTSTGDKPEGETLSPVAAVADVQTTAIPHKPILSGSQANSETTEREEEIFQSGNEQQTIIPENPTQLITEPVIGDAGEQAAGSVTEIYAEQQTPSNVETELQQSTISHVHEESMPEENSVAPQLVSSDEESATTEEAGDSHEQPNPSENVYTTHIPIVQDIVFPSEDDQHVYVPQNSLSVPAESASQTTSHEDKIIGSVDSITTEHLIHDIDLQTIKPVEHDDQQGSVTLGAVLVEGANQPTTFSTGTENYEKVTQRPIVGGEPAGASSESVEVGTVSPSELETEANTIPQGVSSGNEIISATITGETQTALPVNPDIPSQISTGAGETETISGNISPLPVVPSIQETYTTDVFSEQSTSVPGNSEVILTSKVPTAEADNEMHITEHEAEEAVTTFQEESQTTAPQNSISTVDTMSSEDGSEQSQTISLEETDNKQLMTTTQPISSSEGNVNLEGIENQQSSAPSETGIQLTNISHEPLPEGLVTPVTEEIGIQQTVSFAQDGAQTTAVHQPVSESEIVSEASSSSETDIQHSSPTELPIQASEGTSSGEETNVHITTSEIQQPALHEEEITSEETITQTDSHIESDIQQTVVTEGLSLDLSTANQVSSIIPHNPDEQSNVSHQTDIMEEHNTHEIGGLTDTPEGTDLQASTSKVPVIAQSEHNRTESFGHQEAVEESVAAVDYLTQAPTVTDEHHTGIVEQSSQESITNNTFTHKEESHTTSPASQVPVELPEPDNEEEHITNKPAETPTENEAQGNVEGFSTLQATHGLEHSTQYPDSVASSQAVTEQASEQQAVSSSTFYPVQQTMHSSTSHPSSEKIPEDHAAESGEGIEHITEDTKHPPSHLVTRPPHTTASHHHSTQHPEDQYEQFPFGEGQYPTGTDTDYEDEEQAAFGPGTCRYAGKVYVSAQQIPRDDPCDFCFCFRSDIICLQQSCPPPITGCHEEPIQGFCCPRYECPVSMATVLNISTTTTTTTTTLPPHFLAHHYKGAARRTGCQVQGTAYRVGEVVHSASGPCLECRCGGDGQMKCDPKECSPEPMLRKMIMAAASTRR